MTNNFYIHINTHKHTKNISMRVKNTGDYKELKVYCLVLVNSILPSLLNQSKEERVVI